MFSYAIGSVGDLNQDRLKGELKSSVLKNSLFTAPEAVIYSFLKKKVFWKIFQYSQENSFGGASF